MRTSWRAAGSGWRGHIQPADAPGLPEPRSTSHMPRTDRGAPRFAVQPARATHAFVSARESPAESAVFAHLTKGVLPSACCRVYAPPVGQRAAVLRASQDLGPVRVPPSS